MVVATFALTRSVCAHGTNIVVTQQNNRLVVSGGLADSSGYAPMIFVEDDIDGEFETEQTFSGFGYSTVWQIPGFNLSGLAEGSGLYLDVLSRPFAHATPATYRSLWYSDPQSAGPIVTATPADHPLQIRKSASVNVVVSPTSGADPAPLQIASPAATDMGADKHLVIYLLRYDTTDSIAPPVGAYGIFARLTSNVYAPSDPFLIVINNGVEDFPQMVPAARAINAAAFLPGDYNHDERVDAADYVIWRKTLNSTTALAADGSYNQVVDQPDYTAIWRRSFGTTIAGSGVSISAVPEPNGWVLGVIGVGGFLLAITMRLSNRPAISSRRPQS
jgi:hypothetical protein